VKHCFFNAQQLQLPYINRPATPITHPLQPATMENNCPFSIPILNKPG